ncbi:MAG: peptidoglycan-binding protein, partial [Verrucomicrobiota bacterium]|nr:peptidoglycan-binding protein [Verrucomicrobiota bacterium]
MPSKTPMKGLIVGLFIFAVSTLLAHADDQMRSVQTELKNQGFYYGAVDGQPGAETTAAIRRFQIRNGLEVTGQLNRETLASLKIGGGQPALAKRGDTTSRAP